MPRVASEGWGLFKQGGKVYGVELELLDDSTIRVKKGSPVVADDFDLDALTKSRGGSTVLPMFRDAVAKAASGSRGAGEVDSLMLDPSGGITDPTFVPNGGFVTPTGLPNSSARMPDGRPPLFAELDLGSTGENATEKALADARARKAAREARNNGPSIETSRIR